MKEIAKRSHVLIMLLLFAATGVVTNSWVGERSEAATGHFLLALHHQDDSYYNYDFTSPNLQRPDRSQPRRDTNVDWAIDLLFVDHAKVDTIKYLFSNEYSVSGSGLESSVAESPAYDRVNNAGLRWQWDKDKGMKQALCARDAGFGDVYHVRLYAPSGNDHFYAPHWGFYVLGSTHIDHNECPKIDDWTGYNEKAERHMQHVAADIEGRNRVHRDRINMYNPETVAEGSHHWDNDGKATTIHIK